MGTKKPKKKYIFFNRNKIMTAKELANILMEYPDNEVLIIDYDAPVGEYLKDVCIYNDVKGLTVLSYQ